MNSAEKCAMAIAMAHPSNTDHFFRTNEEAVRLASQIRKFLTEAFSSAGCRYEQKSLNSQEDGGVFLFSSASEAHQVAVNLLRIADAQNALLGKDSDQQIRSFRAGIAVGGVKYEGRQEASGPGILMAGSLDASGRPENGGCSGEIRICPKTYQTLPQDLRCLYGGQEIVGTAKEEVLAHRMIVARPAPWEKECRPPAPNSASHEKIQDCFVISPIDDDSARIAEVSEQLILPACKRSGFR